MPLQPGVDGEAPSSWVHTCHILHIADLLECHLLPIIPVGVVKVLPQQCVRLYGAVRVNLGHVHVIDEVDHLFLARRTVLFTSLLLERLLHHLNECHMSELIIMIEFNKKLWSKL